MCNSTSDLEDERLELPIPQGVYNFQMATHAHESSSPLDFKDEHYGLVLPRYIHLFNYWKQLLHQKTHRQILN